MLSLTGSIIDFLSLSRNYGMLLVKHQKVFIMCLYNMVIYLFVVNIVEHVTHIIFVLSWVIGDVI